MGTLDPSAALVASSAAVFYRQFIYRYQMQVSRPLSVAPVFPLPAFLSYMVHWTECLHGDGSLRETLIEFSDLVSAEVVHLHRVNTLTGAQRTIATLDRHASDGARPLTRALGLSLVGQTSSRAKPGTLWSMLELDHGVVDRLDHRVLAWMEARGFQDAVLIPLSTSGEQTDVLEFYLGSSLDKHRRIGMETLASAMAEAWGRRPRGRIARILRAAPAIDEHLQSERRAHPLSESNPLGLTAAEFRICSLIRDGADPIQTSEILGIAESTLRSHLRSIFVKAEVTGQVGLVRLLLDQQAIRTPMQA